MVHLLEADSIILDYGDRRILSDVYLKCETGKITGLLGRNGCGKTSLMNIIYGNLNPNSRSVRFDEQTIYQAYNRPDLLLYLPQFNFIPKGLTLKRIFLDFNLDYNELEVRFPDFKQKYLSKIGRLSGGQRRLVEIFIILKTPSKFALIDEPFSHISPLMIEGIKGLMQELKYQKGLLITDHMYRDIIDISDHLYVLKDGKTHLTKEPGDIERLGYARL